MAEGIAVWRAKRSVRPSAVSTGTMSRPADPTSRGTSITPACTAPAAGCAVAPRTAVAPAMASTVALVAAPFRSPSTTPRILPPSLWSPPCILEL